jgi:hypothetical protein
LEEEDIYNGCFLAKDEEVDLDSGYTDLDEGVLYKFPIP